MNVTKIRRHKSVVIRKRGGRSERGLLAPRFVGTSAPVGALRFRPRETVCRHIVTVIIVVNPIVTYTNRRALRNAINVTQRRGCVGTVAGKQLRQHTRPKTAHAIYGTAIRRRQTVADRRSR